MNIFDVKIKYLLCGFVVVAFLFAGCNDDDYDDKIPPKMYSSEDFERYLIQNFDLDGDNHISIREAQNVKEIDCSRMHVSSLECLQFFTELEWLDCSENYIEYLDFTKNVKLKRLIIRDSYRLDSINLSANVELEVLEYSSTVHKSLAYLDLRNNINLKKLYCANSKLNALDISNNKKLEELYLSELNDAEIKMADTGYDLLKRLHCSNIGNFESLNLENSQLTQLYYSNVGGINSLNLSGCSKLDSLDLQVITEENKLFEVNLTGCSSLRYLSLVYGEYDFTGLNACVELEEIAATGNIDLKNFDLKNVPNLRKVSFFHNNRISTLDISNNKKLEELNLGDLNNADIKSINIEGSSSLRKVSCFNLSGVSMLSFSGCDMLDSLHCDFVENGNQKVNVNVTGCSSLTYLNLTGGMYSISDIKSCSRLKELRLNGDIDISNNTQLEHVVLENGYLLSPISGNGKLKTLRCITVKDAEIFDLSSQPLLEELYCEGIIPVNIEKNKALKILNIAKNYDNNATAAETKFVLKDFPYLEEVVCNYYPKISTMEVENCPNLKLLDVKLLYETGIDTLKIADCANLSGIVCNDSKIKALDIQNCPDIEQLNCGYNRISELHLDRLLKLRNLDCGVNNLAELDLSKNIELAHLSCYTNEKMKELDLRHNENLRYLSCSSGSDMMVYLLEENSISFLYTPGCNVVYVK